MELGGGGEAQELCAIVSKLLLLYEPEKQFLLKKCIRTMPTGSVFINSELLTGFMAT